MSLAQLKAQLTEQAATIREQEITIANQRNQLMDLKSRVSACVEPSPRKRAPRGR